ncbi:nitrate- and nitrite sensing domain-containing protein [Streptomyces formicae]|uniref:histidine kinase n=1 Tax=Streptomyces formicae TaxID=1616117 RepID=A0ABY3WFZ6_9ACTN|nr:nitrate- and nitrite sensing domain-containing protein [Streptomyces formicae]UNM11488.1 nitrate- and nitrite sensing domain-containing protein [Streptomyces formicae]UNM11491.1 nitrate- and nitrite sensing domain-containing protein [Streptomyces formicae]
MRRSKSSSAEQLARGNFTPPPRAAASPADVQPVATPTSGSSSRLSPRNWRVPTRLNAILLIPALVALVMGGFQVKGSIDTWNEAQDAEKTALIVRAASDYGQALLNERDLTAEPLLQGKRDAEIVEQTRAATDAAKKKFDEAVQDMPEKQGLERRLKLFRNAEPALEDLRKGAYTVAIETAEKKPDNSGGPVATQEGYIGVQHYLMEFSNELGLGTGNVTSFGRMVYAIQLAKAAESLQRSIGMELLVRPSDKQSIKAGQVVAFSSYAYLEGIALGEYVSGGTDEDTEKLKTVMGTKSEEGAAKLAAAAQQAKAAGIDFKAPPVKNGSVYDGMVAAISTGDEPEELAARGVTPTVWMAAATAKFDGYTEIEKELVDKSVSEAARIADEARTDAIVNGLITVLALLTAFIVAGMVARQMSRSMRRLRTAAFGIAEQRLPMLVDQLSRTEPGRVDTRVQPIPIDTQDEIGEVARAFDQVHREAVRLAAEQALLRGNVNAIFTNLSRRNQSLIEGQLTLITDLENNEADPDQLENLFKLDHLATRMRRNGENLLVLAGEEPGRRWNQPVPLVDVLRAASSEVEAYERIELTGVPESEIHGQAVTDLVHLLAELLENATTFSSPQTKVRVTATRLPDGRVMVEIHDKGIGLTAEDFADINHKLANPPTVDAAVSQRMGLFVVGRLADRHGIRVQLRPSGEQAGTTSLVMLPDAITHGGGGEPAAAQDDFTVSQMIPTQQAFDSAPMRTAAELGFDDSRYEEQPADSRQLDPVNRSLMREERRAALGSQAHGGDRPLFRDEAQQPAYGEQEQYAEYADGQYADEQYDQGFAPQEQQPSYEQNGYGYDGGDGYGRTGEFPVPGGYPEHADQGYAEGSYDAPQEHQAQYDAPIAHGSHQSNWADQGGYQGAYEPEYRQDAESAPGAPANGADRVGFDRPGVAPSNGHQLTDAGLPRRGGGQPAQGGQAAQTQAPQEPQNGRGEAEGSDGWRSANDERWQRAEKLRKPAAGGVTPSGLPRRVPKANLVEGTAEQTPQGGPQVSRAPEDVRGRLSNLRRGVQKGRSAGNDTNGMATHDRQSGPGNTYNQER